ncbi:MAG: hypothetical protein RR197_01580, partial [Oscillospiraceae bacterium]
RHLPDLCAMTIEELDALGETVQQFFASSETGAGAWCNPNCPEEKAVELRAAYERYLAEK